MSETLFALISMLPAIIGPLPEEGRTITALLCGEDGITRSIEIDIPEDQDGSPPPCRAKACHSGNCRKRFDLAQ